jgi:hypothetical protein
MALSSFLLESKQEASGIRKVNCRCRTRCGLTAGRIRPLTPKSLKGKIKSTPAESVLSTFIRNCMDKLSIVNTKVKHYDS